MGRKELLAARDAKVAARKKNQPIPEPEPYMTRAEGIALKKKLIKLESEVKKLEGK